MGLENTFAQNVVTPFGDDREPGRRDAGEGHLQKRGGLLCAVRFR
jgi:hypothetical protein